MSAPLVSVSMVTFNHSGWITEAIESALAQDLGDLEVVVGDDRSTDGTLDEARAVAARDPRVRVLPTPEKLGPRANYMRTLGACRGRYVNQLDGDDYFLDPSKLRVQVARVESDPSLVGSFSASQRVDADGRPAGEPRRPPGRRTRYGLADFARWCLADSSAVLFRRDRLAEFPRWFRDAPQGDWPLHMLNLRHGDFGYVDEVLTAYRLHGRGVWNGKDVAARARGNLECQRLFLTELGAGVAERLRPVIARHVLTDAKHFAREGELAASRECLDWLDRHARAAAPWMKRLHARAVHLRARLATGRGAERGATRG